MPLAKIQNENPIVTDVQLYERAIAAASTQTVEAQQAGKSIRILRIMYSAYGSYEVFFNLLGNATFRHTVGNGASVVLDFSDVRMQFDLTNYPCVYQDNQISVGKCYVTMLYELLDN